MNDTYKRRLLAVAGPLLVLAGCGPVDAPTPAELDGPPRGLVIVSPPSPILSPDQETVRDDRPFFHDFGHVRYGEVLEHVFKLVNTDPVPVTVRDILPSCGCTTPRITARAPDGTVLHGKLKGEPVIVLPPGSEASLTVRIDTGSMRSFNVDKLETVRLRSDSVHTPFISFETHVLVRRLFQAMPAKIDFEKVPAAVGARESARVTSYARGSLAEITGIDSVEGPIRAYVSKGMILDDPLWTVQVEVEPGEPLGALKGAVHLACVGQDGEPADPFTIEVYGQIAADVVVEPPGLHFLSLGGTAGNRVEARVRCLVPGSRVKVLGGRAEGEAAERLHFEAAAIDPGASGSSAQWRIVLSADPSLAGTAFAGTLVIELDDPTVPTIEVPYSSRTTP